LGRSQGGRRVKQAELVVVGTTGRRLDVHEIEGRKIQQCWSAERWTVHNFYATFPPKLDHAPERSPPCLLHRLYENARRSGVPLFYLAKRPVTALYCRWLKNDGSFPLTWYPLLNTHPWPNISRAIAPRHRELLCDLCTLLASTPTLSTETSRGTIEAVERNDDSQCRAGICSNHLAVGHATWLDGKLS